MKFETLDKYGLKGQWHFWVCDFSFLCVRFTNQNKSLWLQIFFRKPFLKQLSIKVSL